MVKGRQQSKEKNYELSFLTKRKKLKNKLSKDDGQVADRSQFSNLACTCCWYLLMWFFWHLATDALF